MKPFYRFGLMCCRIYCTLLYHIEYIGMENLPSNGGFILASNHITATDPLFIGIKLKRALHFMAKVELFKNPLIGKILRGVGAFPVSRGAGDTSAIDTAISTVKNGNVLAIFPEGTRSKDGELRRLKSGAIYVASQTGADVVPTIVYLKEFEKGLRFRSHVVVRYGKVIPHELLKVDKEDRASVRHANERLRDAMQALLEECRQ